MVAFSPACGNIDSKQTPPTEEGQVSSYPRLTEAWSEMTHVKKKSDVYFHVLKYLSDDSWSVLFIIV